MKIKFLILCLFTCLCTPISFLAMDAQQKGFVNTAIFLESNHIPLIKKDNYFLASNEALKDNGGGPIINTLLDAVTNNVKVIVASSALVQSILYLYNKKLSTLETDKINLAKKAKKLIKNINKKWKIFKTNDKQFGIFINILNSKKINLKQLGLNENLIKINDLKRLKENFFEPVGKNNIINIKTLNNIFQKKIPKFVYITGHGMPSKQIRESKKYTINKSLIDRIKTSQLTHKQNNQFLKHMSKTGCHFLYYNTCFIGGFNSMLIDKIITKKINNLSKDVYQIKKDKKLKINFPIVFGGTPDISTIYEESKDNFKTFFNRLHTFFGKRLINKKTIRSINWIEKPFRNIVKPICGNFLQNIPSIMLPGIRNPIKTILVDDEFITITYPYLILHEIKSLGLKTPQYWQKNKPLSKKDKQELTKKIKQRVSEKYKQKLKEKKIIKTKPIEFEIINNYQGKKFGGWDIDLIFEYKTGYKKEIFRKIKYKESKKIYITPGKIKKIYFNKLPGQWSYTGFKTSTHSLTPEHINIINELSFGDKVRLNINRTDNRYSIKIILKKEEKIIPKKEKTILQSIKKRTQEIKPIEVKDKKAILLYPMITSIPIKITGSENPKIISMIPGKTFHYIKAINIGDKSIENFIKFNIKFKQIPDKLFLIGEITGNNIRNARIKNVLIHKKSDLEGEITVNYASFIEYDGHWGYWTDKHGNFIDHSQVKSKFEKFKDISTPLNAALFQSSGGIESKKQFDKIFSNIKWDDKVENKTLTINQSFKNPFNPDHKKIVIPKVTIPSSTLKIMHKLLEIESKKKTSKEEVFNKLQKALSSIKDIATLRQLLRTAAYIENENILLVIILQTFKLYPKELNPLKLSKEEINYIIIPYIKKLRGE